jgi:alanine racemase
MPVKADAYGHGAARIAETALAAGVRHFAVATVDEGAELRAAGIEAPILLLSIPLPSELYKMAASGLSPFVCDMDSAEAFAEIAAKTGKTLGVHIKVDTGMGRIGCRPEAAAELAAYIASCAYMRIEGTATHLALADGKSAAAFQATARQLERFSAALAAIREAGVDPGLVHAANSGAVLLHPEACFDMVRPGIMLYGYPPSSDTAGIVELRPLMRLVTQVVFVKRLSKGETVSYGGTWTAAEDTVIATLPVGYGDGLPRALSNDLPVSIRGASYPLRGRICMDQCVVEIGPDSNVRCWDEAVIFGDRDHAAVLDAAGIADKLHTIPYEITCGINKRVPRVYE